MRTRDLLAVAGHVARTTPQLWSLEAWGGATYDVALRFLSEDPWERLAALRQAVPNICLQMLLRGRNTVGYTPYPTEVTEAFVHEAAATGIDVFRIFDALNDVEQMRPAIEAVRATGTTVAEVALCYTGDLSDPGETLYTLDYYLRLAERIVEAGAHVLAIKDMAGLLRAPAARTLVRALRERFDLPVHLHTHDTPGGQLATLLAAIDAGVDAVDAACASMAGTTSQPALSALVATTDHTDARDRPRPAARSATSSPTGRRPGGVYAPFESGLASPTGRVYTHEIPGGQLSNLRQQAISLGLGEKFEQIEDMYAAANDILGNIVKVTPSSKVVGDLALHLVAVGADPAEFEEEPRRVRRARLGHRLPLRRPRRPARRLARAVPHQGAGRSHRQAVAAELDADQRAGPGAPTAAARSTRCCSPARPRSSRESREKYGDISVLPTARLPLRPARRRGAPGRPRGGQAADLRAAGGQRRRRARHPHGDVHDQRPAAAGQRARPVRRPRTPRPPRRPTPPSPATSPRPFDGVVTLVVGRGRHRRGRRHRRDHRGDEDGGLDHRTGRRHRRAARRSTAPSRSRAATSSWSSPPPDAPPRRGVPS